MKLTNALIHETAHALASLLLTSDHARLISVTSDRTERDYFRTRGPAKTVARWAQAEIMMLLAGGAAERLIGFTGRQVRASTVDDWRAVRLYADVVREQGGRLDLLRLRREVEFLLCDHWQLLLSLAAALAERGTLTGQEFVALVEAFLEEDCG